jgi:glycosyltransferase involved in cell wall biosynthesis
VRRSAWAGPSQPWRLRARRALSRTSGGYLLKLWLRRGRLVAKARLRRDELIDSLRPRRPPSPPRSFGDTPVRNILLISHCDFTGNSAVHAYSIASELQRRGFSPAIAVPSNAASVRDLGQPSFPVLAYRDVRKGRLHFPDGHGVELAHAFTPREHVRRFALELGREQACPYVVHLEDNEDAIGAGRFHPRGGQAFVAGAAGVTVVIDRLLEFKPDNIPGVVIWPGFDEAVLSPRRDRAQVRAKLGLGSEELALLYNGNIHDSNLEEVCSLYLAVSLLRRAGCPAVLVKTGWNFVPRSRLPKLGDALHDLGWVARTYVPELLSAADVLVQPGRSDPFNDYRFPSKLPEFLASGRPVVLPRANIGLHLEDGVEALLLERGDAMEIVEKVERLMSDEELRLRIGNGGRAFALQQLRWAKTVGRVVELYELIQGKRDVREAGLARRRHTTA